MLLLVGVAAAVYRRRRHTHGSLTIDGLEYEEEVVGATLYQPTGSFRQHPSVRSEQFSSNHGAPAAGSPPKSGTPPVAAGTTPPGPVRPLAAPQVPLRQSFADDAHAETMQAAKLPPAAEDRETDV